MSINVQNVTKLYDKQRALDGVTFSIKSGEIVGFLGPNGAGKSTLMKIMTGFIPPSEGDVMINGKSILNNALEVKKTIGYLPENNPLYLEMYVKEYLSFMASIHLPKQKIRSRVKEIVDLTGLTIEQNKKIGSLSKGYRQRTGLAQALIHNPEVLILDEPTTGLDPNQIVEIRNLISKIGKEKTVILSTHIMQEVDAICDRVIIINKGQIVADEKPGNIQDILDDKVSVVIVEFNKEIDPVIFKELPGQIKYMKQKDKTWLLESPSEKDIRGDIFHLAVNHELTVLSMQKQEKSLEEVFKQLTRN
ncbi:MAG: gliding motility-associated ABC transporter ATP-binding subunit GldA [Bacteroidales bacterium]